jgi:predicted Rossmann fold flavoprotein
MAMIEFDVAVIGAGAAGMMCAAVAGQRGRRVVLIEHYDTLGEKIRISGGGRCNFTNVHAGPAHYLSQNPDFCRSALARFTPRHFIELVERHGIAYHEKTLGQLFCDGSSLQIIRMLEAECGRGGVAWRMPCAVLSVTREAGAFVVATTQGAVRATSLAIASGGLTVPKIGATPFGYRIAEQFGLKVVAPRPALVPLALAPDALARFGELAGVSIDADVSFDDTHFRENILFTHRGLSGPGILQISSYWDGKRPLSIDLAPEIDVERWLAGLRESNARLDNVLAQQLPKRFAQQWCEAQGIAIPLAQLGANRLCEIAAELHRWSVMPSGTLGYNKAEVTIGGVDTRDLSSKTMAAHDVGGLFFIGEVVDVTGWLGGYNFQWAWASGHAAGMAA